MSDNNNVQTSVQQVDLDLDSWLGAPGAESIVTPTESKPTIFSKGTVDLDFLNANDDDVKDGNDSSSGKQTIVSAGTVDEIIDDAIGQDDDVFNKGGRPRTEKSGLVEFLKKITLVQ